MNYEERLISAGIRPDCAVETVSWFKSQGDENALERYTKEAEERAGICTRQ